MRGVNARAPARTLFRTMVIVLIAAMLAQVEPCRVQAEPYLAMAEEQADRFDVAAAAALAFEGAGYGCPRAEVAGHYLRGLLAGREAYRQGGSSSSLAPVLTAGEALDALTMRDPVLAPIARVVMQAVVAAAQSERDQMGLLLEHALRLEAVQLEAGQPGLPIVTAHETAGDLWLQVHGYDEARRAFEAAEQRVGRTPRVMLGLARAAARLKDTAAACARYRALVAGTQGLIEGTAELGEARAYLQLPPCVDASPSQARP